MKRGELIILSEYKAKRLAADRALGRAGAVQVQADADQLRELLDRNISLRIWKEGI